MTTHYVTTLGVAKCREILRGMPDCEIGQQFISAKLEIYYRNIGKNWFFWLNDEWLQLGDEFKAEMISLANLRAELSAHDTDSCTDIRNHLSPNTVVVG